MGLRRREFLEAAAALAAVRVPGLRLVLGDPREAGRRVLVVVQLTGGNDGLNTVVPFEDDAYYRARPRLRVPKGEAVKLDTRLGLHPSLAALRAPWDRGELAIVQGVGYPAPDRSHFRSMDVWHTASTDVNAPRTGWLGRAGESFDLDGASAPCVHVGSTEQPLSLVAAGSVNPSLVDVERTRLRSHVPVGGFREALRAACRGPREGAAGWIASAAVSAIDFSERLDNLSATYRESTPYPNTALARRLRTVDQLLCAGSAVRAAQVEIDGFDTHASQAEVHGQLLRELAEALTAFHANLRAHGLDERAVVFVFSEFGRRVRENASGGTDHGAAAPVLLLGARVKGGFHGSAPDLENLDEGDVAMTVDFRRVYASLLGKWLGVEPGRVLGGAFEPLQVL